MCNSNTTLVKVKLLKTKLNNNDLAKFKYNTC